MKVTTLALVLIAMLTPACTFGVVPHAPQPPAEAPCERGPACPVDAGFAWFGATIESARR